MPATGLRKALDQRIGLGIEVQKAYRPALCMRGVDDAGQSIEPGLGLYIEHDRDPILRRSLECREERWQLRERDVRDRVIATVLERGERDALAGTRYTADQQQVHRRRGTVGRTSGGLVRADRRLAAASRAVFAHRRRRKTSSISFGCW